MTQLARAIADTGHATLRDGAPARSPPLAVPDRPAWWIDAALPTRMRRSRRSARCSMTARRSSPPTGWRGCVRRPVARCSRPRPARRCAGARLRADPRQGADRVSRRDARALPHRPLARAADVAALAVAAAACLARLRSRATQLAVLFVVLASRRRVVVWRVGARRRRRTGWTTRRLGRRGDARARRRARRARIRRPPLDVVVRRDDVLQGPDARLRRSGRPAPSRSGSGSCPFVAGARGARLRRAAARWPTANGRFAITAAASLASFGIYAAVKARLPLDDLREPHAGAEPHLPRRRSSSPERRCSSSGAAARLWAVVGRRRGSRSVSFVDTPFGLSYPNYEAHGFSMLPLREPHLPLGDTRHRARLIARHDRGHDPARPACRS